MPLSKALSEISRGLACAALVAIFCLIIIGATPAPMDSDDSTYLAPATAVAQ